MKSTIIIAITAAVCVLNVAAAETLVCDGVLGNSGEQGESLVRFNAAGARGMGVVCDRFGSLWDRGGDGVLNRYALDGRLLAQYRIPAGSGGNDQIALVGDTIVLAMRGELYSLPIESPAGAEAKPMGRKAGCISFGSTKGCFAAADGDSIMLINPATGDATKAATLGGVQCLDLAPDGTVYAMADWKLRKFADGKEVTDGWPKAAPGERPQLIDGFWFGHAWHGTIRRYTAAMDPAPGVVLGGASGSFIGHLDQNSDLVNGRGMARLRDDLFAVSGMGGILHLAQWDGSKRQMQLVRRIGCVPVCRGLGLDRAGNVWCRAGSWKWNDLPDTPLGSGVNDPEHPGICQAVMLDTDCMAAPGWLWGMPTFYSGKLSTEVRCSRIEGKCALTRGGVACTAYKRDGKLLLLVLDAAGKGQAFRIASDGSYQGDDGPVVLKTAADAREWTALAMKDATTLLAAADGAVIEFAAGGNDWDETKRWSSWGQGPADKFGGKLYICADSGRLWAADRERHRVLVFDLATQKLIATFGTPDKQANGLDGLAFPEVIVARGNRAVVFDSANQRLVKLSIR